MKIAHKFPEERSRVVTLGGVSYAFTPADPNDPASPHVAEVTNEEHIQRFLSITEGYRIYSDTAASRPAPVVPSTAAPSAPEHSPSEQSTVVVHKTHAVGPSAPDSIPQATVVAPAETPAATEVASGTSQQSAADPAVTKDEELTPEIKEAAANLNGLSWQKLKAETNKGDIAQAVLKEALAIELRKPDVDRRETTIKILQALIKE